MATIITFPTISGATSATLRLVRNDARFTSPLSNATQDLQRAGARWEMDLSWSTMSQDDWSNLGAWAAQMAKAGVRSAIANPAYEQRGSGGGSSPKVDGASQTGNSFKTKNWNDSITGILKAGDLIGITDASGLHQTLMVVADADSDSSGKSTLSVEPPLRISPADGASITLNPKIYFYLSQPSFSQAYTPPRFAAMSISLVEDILI